MVFPAVDMLNRHPSQLYEALLEGLVLFLILNFIILKRRYKVGFNSSLFLIFYGIFRIIAEQFREPDYQIGYLFGSLSMGALLSIAMIISGIFILIILKKKMKSDLKFFKKKIVCL